MSTFSSMETLITSLRVQSLAQQLVTNNIANAATKGFSRRLPVLAPGPALAVPRLNSSFGPGQIGSGVTFSRLQRIRDEFLDVQARIARSEQGQRQAVYDAVKGMGALFPEINSTGVDPVLFTPGSGFATQLGVLFDAFAALAVAPGSGAARAAVAGEARTLANQLNAGARTLAELRALVDGRLRQGIDRVNELLSRIAQANEQIIRGGAPAADHQDQRDLALDEVATYLRADVVTMADGSVAVFTGNARLLVQGSAAARLEATATVHEPRFAGIGLRAQPGGALSDISSEIATGKLGGWQQARDEVLGEEALELDELASSLVAQVNLIHRAGYGADGTTTSMDFFQGDRAINLTVNAALTSAAGQAKIAASRINGDGTNGDQAATLGFLKGLIMNASLQSDVFMHNGGDPLDPTRPLNSAVHTALNGANPFATNQADWLVAPVADGTPAIDGTLVINGTAIAWDADSDSLDDIIARIHTAFGGTVRASFDYTTQRFALLSAAPLTVSDAAGNLADALHLQTFVTSLAPANNGGGPLERPIGLATPLNQAASVLSMRTPAAPSGTLRVNGVSVVWDAGQDPTTILANVNAALGGAGVPLFASFDPVTQRFFVQGNQAAPGGARVPLTLDDAAGNLGFVLNLESQPAFGAYADTLVGQFQALFDDAGTLRDAAGAAVEQGDIQRDTVAKVDIEQEKAQLVEFMRAYQAAVRAIAAMDETLNTLINRMAASSFAGASTSSVITS